MNVGLALARTLLDLVAELAAAEELRLSAVVVDHRGNEVAAARMDGASWFTLGIARAKAATAVAFDRPSHELSGLREAFPESLDLAADELSFSVTTLAGGVLLPGGGALGVSGALPETDLRIARAAVERASAA